MMIKGVCLQPQKMCHCSIGSNYCDQTKKKNIFFKLKTTSMKININVLIHAHFHIVVIFKSRCVPFKTSVSAYFVVISIKIWLQFSHLHISFVVVFFFFSEFALVFFICCFHIRFLTLTMRLNLWCRFRFAAIATHHMHTHSIISMHFDSGYQPKKIKYYKVKQNFIESFSFACLENSNNRNI